MCDIEKIRAVQLELMDELHRICTENGFTYYLMSGSVLGAVRHQGFIPWDVDIDIGMPRPDYDGLRDYFLSRETGPYVYHDYTNTPDYIPPHALLCKRGTRLTTKYTKYNTLQREHGIFVDIIPLDSVASEPRALRRVEKRLGRIQRLKEYKIAYLYRPFTAQPIKHTLKKLIRLALFGISLGRINKMEDRVMRSGNGTDSPLWAAMGAGYRFEKECMPKDVYGTPTPAVFEGRSYFIPEKAHEYLTVMYGDYMRLPSEEVQNEGYHYYESVFFDEDAERTEA